MCLPDDLERFMGGTHGFNNMPNKKFSFITGMRGSGGEPILPGLSNFCFVGVWASMAPALFGMHYPENSHSNALQEGWEKIPGERV